MEQRISIERLEQAINLFGSFDENIRLIESEFHVTVANREGELRVNGEPEDTMLACKALSALLTLSNRGEAINEQNVRYVIGLARSGQEEKIGELTQDVICISAKGRPIKPKTIGQKEYVDSISQNTVTIGVGPAGTGKTYLAVAAAVAAFRERKINRIILTRPAVEAGERLGFLPGDLQSKVDPYLRPLYDALFDMLGAETYQKYLERGNIEVAPLAYMRGRTLDDSFIILDEAQNTSCEQMKMFLTRMGFGSKMVITGDATQIDLPAADTAHIGKMTATQVANAFFSSTPAHFVSSTSSGMPPPPPKMPFVSPATTPLRRYFVFFSMSPTPYVRSGCAASLLTSCGSSGSRYTGPWWGWSHGCRPEWRSGRSRTDSGNGSRRK